MTSRRHLILGLCAAPLGLVFAPGAAATRASQATPVASPVAEEHQISVYFLREGPRTDQVGAAHRMTDATETDGAIRAALDALIAGPNALETDAGLFSAVPSATTVLGITLDSAANSATVDLSADVTSGEDGLPIPMMAQIVYTLTQFPEVERATISIAGTPIAMRNGDGIALDGPATRADYDHTTPLIFLESPAPGDTIGTSVRLWGTANTFEGEFRAEILGPDGERFASQIVSATSGNGVRGTFDVTLTFDPGDAETGQVTVYETSERRGRRDNEVVIPVVFNDRD